MLCVRVRVVSGKKSDLDIKTPQDFCRQNVPFQRPAIIASLWAEVSHWALKKKQNAKAFNWA